MFCEIICKVTGITHPVAKGIAIGTSSHAIGTARAMQLGEVEGAMSGLSIVISGMITLIGTQIFCRIYLRSGERAEFLFFLLFILTFVIQI